MITALSLSPDRLRTRFIHVRARLVGKINRWPQFLDLQINFVKPQLRWPRVDSRFAFPIRQLFQGEDVPSSVVIYDSSQVATLDPTPQVVIHPSQSQVGRWLEIKSDFMMWGQKLKQRIEHFRVPKSSQVLTKVVTAEHSSPSAFTKVAQGLSLGVIGLAVMVAAVIFVPQLYYTLFPANTIPIEAATEGTPLGGNFDLGANTAIKEKAQTPERYLPPQDDSLPDGDWIIIPRIGVRTELQRTYDVEAALEKGVLWEPDYGQPGDLDIPMIVVAHRFGYKWWWKSDYWKYHSFYLLPELEPGDLVEVISDHRKWTYEIYAGEEGEEVTDFEADMILYTCKYLNSSIRHFRYARIINMNTDTQAD